MPKLPGNFFNNKTGKLLKNEKNMNYLIVKGNQIVQDAHFTMPLLDQKVMASLIRSIKPGQKSLTVHFSTRDFMEMMGLKPGGRDFSNIMTVIRNIARDVFWIKMPDGTYRLWQWTVGASADPYGHNAGDFVVTFNPRLRKYLFSQSMKYRTIYKFSDIMLMKSRYSPRLFEIFRSNQSRQKVQSLGLDYTIKELKCSLNLMRRTKNGKIRRNKAGKIIFKYPRFSDFRRRVLAPTEREINELTEFNVYFTPIKHGHKYTEINVVMKKKNKAQLAKRRDTIYYITHHIPRKYWKKWKHYMVTGRYRKLQAKFRVKRSKRYGSTKSSRKKNQQMSLLNPRTNDK